jgi:hypothetical protein
MPRLIEAHTPADLAPLLVVRLAIGSAPELLICRSLVPQAPWPGEVGEHDVGCWPLVARARNRDPSRRGRLFPGPGPRGVGRESNPPTTRHAVHRFRRPGGHQAPGHLRGLAVTGTADPAALLRIDAGRPGLPLSLTKPIGTGVLNAWYKATGQVRAAAIGVMTTVNVDARRQALAAGIRCATDVIGFGLLGHLFKLARASGVSVVVDHAAVPVIEGTRPAARAEHVPGGSRLNLQWVRPHADAGTVGEDDLLLLADAQTSGGLLVAGGAARRAGDRGAGPAPRQCAR